MMSTGKPFPSGIQEMIVQYFGLWEDCDSTINFQQSIRKDGRKAARHMTSDEYRCLQSYGYRIWHILEGRGV